jgi:hypothetical protein
VREKRKECVPTSWKVVQDNSTKSLFFLLNFLNHRIWTIIFYKILSISLFPQHIIIPFLSLSSHRNIFFFLGSKVFLLLLLQCNVIVNIFICNLSINCLFTFSSFVSPPPPPSQLKKYSKNLYTQRPPLLFFYLGPGLAQLLGMSV